MLDRVTISGQMPQCQYRDNIIGMSVGTFIHMKKKICWLSSEDDITLLYCSLPNQEKTISCHDISGYNILVKLLYLDQGTLWLERCIYWSQEWICLQDEMVSSSCRSRALWVLQVETHGLKLGAGVGIWGCEGWVASWKRSWFSGTVRSHTHTRAVRQ